MEVTAPPKEVSQRIPSKSVTSKQYSEEEQRERRSTLRRLVWRNPSAKSPKGRKIAIGVVGSAAVLYTLYAWLTPGASINELTSTVRQGPFDIVVIETGELQAKRSVNITTPVLASGGRSQLAIQYLAAEGTTVDSGTLVVQFDPQDQFKIMSEKQNELKVAMADMEKLKAQQAADESQTKTDFEMAKLSFELAKLSSGAMKFESDAKQRESQLELRKAELSYQQAEANQKNKSTIRRSEMGNLQLKIGQLQSILERAQADLDRLQVKAPASGLIVYQRSWNTGRKIAKGDQVWGGQPIASLPDLSQMQAIVQVNEVDVSKVKKEQNVVITLDAFPDKQFEGKVLNVAAIGNPKEGNPTVKVFEVAVDIDGRDSVLKPGMTVSARITVNRLPNVLSVPIEAVFQDKSGTVCYMDNGSGSLVKKAVKIGAKNDNFVVIESGLKAGNKVSLIDPSERTQTESVSKKKDTAKSPVRP